MFALFDDAMVSMRYAENLVAGEGLTWSAGERVEGYSNLLWTLAMAAVHLLGTAAATTSLVVMAIGVVLLVLNVLVAGRIADLLVPGSRAFALIAMALVAFAYPLIYWTLRGMEVGLAALLVSLMAMLALEIAAEPTRRRTIWLALTIAAALLTRDDLLVPTIVVLAWLAWTVPAACRVRVVMPLAATAAGVLLAHAAFRLAYYDSLLPNTYHLKLAGIDLATRLERGFVALAYSALRDLWAPLIVAGAYFAIRRRSVPRAAVLLAALFLAQCAYSVYVGADAFEGLLLANRYLSTALPALLVLAALGARAVLRSPRAPFAVAAAFLVAAPLVAWDGLPTDRIGVVPGEGGAGWRPAVALALAAVFAAAALLRRRGSAAPPAPAAAALVTLLLVAGLSGPALRDWAESNYQAREFDVSWVRTGLALREATSPDATVATSAAGNIVYFSDRDGVDLLGKADRVVAGGPPAPGQPFRPGHNKMNFEHSIGTLRPTVVVQPPAAPELLCRLAGWGYEQVAPAIYARSGASGIEADVLRDRTREIPMLSQRYPGPPPGCEDAR